MLYVLTYLEERGIDLERSEFNAESEAINSVYGLTMLIIPARRLLDATAPPTSAMTRFCCSTSAEADSYQAVSPPRPGAAAGRTSTVVGCAAWDTR